MLAGVTVLCAGVTLGIIAGLGQTTSTAAASAIAGAAGIKVGTASIYLYGVFFLLQILMLRSKFKWERCFQLLPILAHGVLLNFFRYRFAVNYFRRHRKPPLKQCRSLQSDNLQDNHRIVPDLTPLYFPRVFYIRP